MFRSLLRYFLPAPPREALRRAELVPRWGMTGLGLFLLAVAPVWPEPGAVAVDPFLIVRTLLTCAGLVFASGAMVISVASVRPGRRR